jgi:SOS-response transcriptional repressor LexA
VGVRHAAITKLDKKSKAGMREYIKAAHNTQPTAMTGPTLCYGQRLSQYRHLRHPQEEKTFPVLLQILAGQFNTNGKHTDGQNDPGDLKRDRLYRLIISITPLSRIEYIGAVRAY